MSYGQLELIDAPCFLYHFDSICLYCLLFNPYIYSCLISCVGSSSYRPVCLEEAVEVFKDGCEVHYQVSFLTSFILFYNCPLKLLINVVCCLVQDEWDRVTVKLDDDNVFGV